jgi:hypothetical protein
MFDVYLAGSMTGRKIKDVLQERANAHYILKAYGLTYYDPASDEGLENLDPNTVICNAFDRPQMEKFVKKDLAAIAQCKALLNITGDLPSEGTDWEMAYATFYRIIPIVLVAPKRHSGARMSFTNILVNGCFETLEEAVQEVQRCLTLNRE